MTITGKNRIMIFGPKDDGTYVVEFRTAAGEALAISIPRNERSAISKNGCLTGCSCRKCRSELDAGGVFFSAHRDRWGASNTELGLISATGYWGWLLEQTGWRGAAAEFVLRRA